ncbi:MAG: DotI/IcmL family type IV secretion protein [Proteobacteria bacterium]|nr:DotI/IcmL family type IV secretion protein [Pseudomonadota bacterium]
MTKPSKTNPKAKPESKAKADKKTEAAETEEVELDAATATSNATTRLSVDNITKILFAATQDEPRATPQMTKFFRGLVEAQSYLLAILLGATILVSVAFATQTFYHLIILDHEGLPTAGLDRSGHRLAQPYAHAPYLMYPLDEPNLTHTAILNMTMNIVTEVLTFGFNNADERLLSARHLFTNDAWQRFAKAYLQYGRLEKIKRYQQVLTAIATHGAVIVSEGMVYHRDRWVTQVPIVTTYQAGDKVAHKRSILQLTLVRASTLEHPEGVAIDGWEELAGGLGVRQGWAMDQ